MDLPQPDRMVPADGQALANTMLAQAGALVHDVMHAPCGSQPLLNPSQTGLFGSQADPFGSQPGGYGASQMDHLLPSSQDGLPGGWHGAGHATTPVKTEPQEEPAWPTGLGLGHAADLHNADWRQQQEQPLKLDPEDEAEYERQLAGGSQPTFDLFQPAQQPWEQEGQPWEQQAQPWQQHPFQRQSMAQQALAWVPQPPVPLTQQQPVPYAVLEPQLHQMFAGQPAAAQQKQQPQPADEEPAAGCGSNRLLLSPAAAMGASGATEDAALAVAACPPATAEAAAAGSRKRKAQQAAGGSPPAKQPAHKPARQAAAPAAPAAAGARSKGGSGSRQPARRGQASSSKSPVRCIAGRAIAKKALQPRTPNEQQLQPAVLAEAAASKVAAKQRKQQAQQGSGMAARRQQHKAAASKAHAAKAAPKQQQAAAKAGACKPASTAGSSKVKAQAGSMGGKACRSKSAAAGSKAAAKPGGKAATGKGGAKAAAGGRKRKAGGSKRTRVSRPCTGNSTGRRKGGMNVPPEKLWAYHMDLLGPGGKAKLAADFKTRTDSLSAKVQSFLRGLLGPKMRLTDESIIYQAGSAQSRPPSLSLDKQRLLAEGITTFGAFATRYFEPADD